MGLNLPSKYYPKVSLVVHDIMQWVFWIPIEDLVCKVEDAISSLPETQAEESQQECAIAIRKAKPPKRNLSPGERIALKT